MRFDIRRLDATSSTNDDAKQAAASGAEAGLVVWALRQNAGRGRQGRVWESPAGNLTFSVLLRPALPLRDWGFYSFAAALAVFDTVRAFLPDAAVALKWPNDVLVGGKKISGLLLEAADDALIVGIGLNVACAPKAALYPATSLVAESGRDFDLATVLTKILEALDARLSGLEASGFEPLRQDWLSHARRGPLTVQLPRERFDGVFEDLDPQGNLCVRLGDGTVRKVGAGDVFF